MYVAELAPRIVQIGLLASQSKRRWESVVETSRVQHYILLFWGIILSRCCSSPVCVLSLNDAGRAYKFRYSYLAKSTSYFGTLPGFIPGDLPPNDTPARLAHGLAEAHAAYGSAK